MNTTTIFLRLQSIRFHHEHYRYYRVKNIEIHFFFFNMGGSRKDFY